MAETGSLDESACLLAMRQARRRNAPQECIRLAKTWGLTREPVSVKALCELLQPPRRWLARLRAGFRHSAWEEARAGAATALHGLHDPMAIPALMNALFDPSKEVRARACEALTSFGDLAVSPLIENLRRDDWTLDGMKAALTLLGTLRSQDATFPLLSVLYTELPYIPARWIRQTLKPVVSLVGLATVGVVASYIGAADFTSLSRLSVQDWLSALILCLFYGFCALLILGLPLMLLFFLPITSVLSARERNRLAQIAAESLVKIRDVRALPKLVWAAFGMRVGNRHAARLALQELLPLLNADNAEQMDGETARLLTRALGDGSERMALSALRAMEFVGTGQALPSVQRLILRGESSEIRHEAGRILPLLQARQRNAQNAASLLRASGRPTAAPDQLLRPALNQTETPPEQLLRSSSNQA